MEEIISYLISILIAVTIVSIVIITRRGAAYLKNKRDVEYDQNRNVKVETLKALVIENISTAISAFFAENEIHKITEENLPEVISGISEKVNALTGDGVIKYLMNVFINNWDEWLYDKILSELTDPDTDYLEQQ